VGGVRMEQTADDGRGVRNDLRATYSEGRARQSDPQRCRSADQSRRRCSGLGETPVYPARHPVEEYYRGYYPSFNASYGLNDFVVFRAGFAKTIGRPDLGNIIPGITWPSRRQVRRRTR